MPQTRFGWPNLTDRAGIRLLGNQNGQRISRRGEQVPALGSADNCDRQVVRTRKTDSTSRAEDLGENGKT